MLLAITRPPTPPFTCKVNADSSLSQHADVQSPPFDRGAHCTSLNYQPATTTAADTWNEGCVQVTVRPRLQSQQLLQLQPLVLADCALSWHEHNQPTPATYVHTRSSKVCSCTFVALCTQLKPVRPVALLLALLLKGRSSTSQ
jgi:hypothetical protein